MKNTGTGITQKLFIAICTQVLRWEWEWKWKGNVDDSSVGFLGTHRFTGPLVRTAFLIMRSGEQCALNRLSKPSLKRFVPGNNTGEQLCGLTAPE